MEESSYEESEEERKLKESIETVLQKDDWRQVKELLLRDPKNTYFRTNFGSKIHLPTSSMYTHKVKSAALLFTVCTGYAGLLKLLIQHGADVDAVDAEKRSALYIAAENGHADVVKVLCQYGADVNTVIKVPTTTQIEELTPLYVVACRGDVDITKVMIENGADVNALVQVEYQDDPYVCFRVRVLRLLI